MVQNPAVVPGDNSGDVPAPTGSLEDVAPSGSHRDRFGWAAPAALAALLAVGLPALLLTKYALEATAFVGAVCLAAGALGVSRRWMQGLLLVGGIGWALRLGLGGPGAHPAVLWLGPGLLLASAATNALVRMRQTHAEALSAQLADLQKDLDGARAALNNSVAEATRVLEKRGETEGLWDWDLKQDCMAFSPRWSKMLGYAPDEIGRSPEAWFNLIHPHDLGRTLDRMTAHLEGRETTFEVEHRISLRDGGYCWVLSRGQALLGPDGRPERVLGSQIHLGRLKSFESKLLHDATHDRLTGLPNRRYLLARLREDMARLERNERYSFCVMLLGLDNFKDINDSLGHSSGDKMLAMVGSRLSQARRPEDAVSRSGGDEFALILRNIRDEVEAMAHARRIQDALSEPFRLDKQQFVARCSIGIAMSSFGTRHAEDLLRNADIAMYHAKSNRKGEVQLFDAEMHVRTRRMWNLQNDLRGAIERDELMLLYQPLVCLRNDRICGAEALIRWKRADGELVSPGEFIPLAEEQGLIGDIGEWALHRACSQNKAWQLQGLRPIKVSVNLSTKQLSNHEFAATVRRVLAETALEPRWLQLELTETALMGSLDATPASLYSLFCMDIHLAIDDFGTGYSSLDYLRRLQFDTLKIDKSFVEDIVQDSRAAALARSIIAMAHSLRMSSLAEGVETAEQLELLRSFGCDIIQGYLASRPIPAEELAQLLHDDVNLLAGVPCSEAEAPDPNRDAPSSQQELVKRFVDLADEPLDPGPRARPERERRLRLLE